MAVRYGCAHSWTAVLVAAGLLVGKVNGVLAAEPRAAAPTPAPAQSSATPVAPNPPAEAASQSPPFDLQELRVLGNSVLEARAIEQAVYPFLGSSRTLKDIEAARAALEKLYHDRGYGTVFVDIPEQTVDAGIVRLKVTEGKLAGVHVTGARYFSGRQIRAAMPAAAPGVVPQLPSLQAEITRVNTVTPDRIVTPVLKAGTSPGTVDLTLRVDDHLPLHGSLEFNNDYTQDTSPLRAIAALSYDNLFGRFDSLSLQWQTAPHQRRQVNVLVGSYVARVSDWRWAFYYLHSSSEVPTLTSGSAGGALSSVLILGKGSVIGSRLIAPLPGTSMVTQNLSLGIEYKDFLQNVNSTSLDPNQPSSELTTPVRYANLSAGYAGFWRGTGRQASLDSSINFAVRGLGNTPPQFENKRFRAQSNYFYWRSAASLGATLPRNFTVLFKLAGQYAAEPLVSNEQFAIAGSDGVRGYLEAEELADTGIKTTLQLGSPVLNWLAGNLHSDGFVFYDFGRTGLLNPLSYEKANASLRSAGVGLNLAIFDHFSGALTWAYPLANGSVTRAHDSRVLFSVRSTW